MNNIFLAIAGYLGEELKLPPDDKEMIAYGLEVVFSNLITLLLVFWGGLLLGALKETVLAAFVWFIIRRFAGGAHCSTLWRCAFLGSFILIVIGLSAVKIAGILGQDAIRVLTACTSLVLVPTFFWAPAPNPKKPVGNMTRRKKLLLMALLSETALILFFLLLVLTTTFTSLAIAGCLSIILVGLMLTPAGYKIITLVDNFLGFLFAKITGREGNQ